MDRSIPGGDLIGRWSLSFADIDFVNSKPALTRLGLAAQLKFFASLGFFAIDPGSIPTDGLSYLAEQPECGHPLPYRGDKFRRSLQRDG